MNKDRKREALEWMVNDTDPGKYIFVDFEGGKFEKPTYCGTKGLISTKFLHGDLDFQPFQTALTSPK